MKIQRATFIGVRGVTDLTLDLTDARTGAPRSLVIVTGPSGSGKTRMLDALVAAKEAIRPYGQLGKGAPWIGPENAAKILLTFHLDEGERDFAGVTAPQMEAEVIFRPDAPTVDAERGLRAVLGRYTHDPARGKVERFAIDRRIATTPPFSTLALPEQRVLRLANDPRKYAFILPFLRTLAQDEVRRERFAAILAALSPTCRYIGQQADEESPRCFSSRDGAPSTAAELSRGESDAVLFAATAAAVGLGHSLVFIDRPDLHVDDDALEAFARGLTSIGEENQLFVTGRAAFAAAASGAHVVTLQST